MRIKIEIEWQGQPWRKIKTVRKIALIDTILGLVLALMYVYKLSFPKQEPTFIQFARTRREQMDLKLAFIFLVAANLIQSLHSLRLYLIVNQQREGLEPAECYSRARRWFDYTEFVYLFAIVKCVASVGYIFTVALHCWVIMLVMITLPEMIFKMWALYRVNGFMLDLKESLKFMPKFKFTPIPGTGLSQALLMPPTSLIGNDDDKHDDKEGLLEADLNANFQQMV